MRSRKRTLRGALAGAILVAAGVAAVALPHVEAQAAVFPNHIPVAGAYNNPDDSRRFNPPTTLAGQFQLQSNLWNKAASSTVSVPNPPYCADATFNLNYDPAGSGF